MEQLQDLINKYAINEKDLLTIFKNVSPELLHGFNPSTDPIAIIIGAQPGAGKSQVSEFSYAQLNGNLVKADSDRWRTHHPEFEKIANFHTKEAGAITNAFAQGFNKLMIAEAINNKFNYALEVAMKKPLGINRVLAEAKLQGYTTCVDLLAVNPLWSRVGIIQRAQEEIKHFGYAREIPILEHDRRCEIIPSTVKAVAEEGLYDNIRLFSRRIVKHNDVATQRVELFSVNSTTPYNDYLEERNRAFTPQETTYFNTLVQSVIANMKHNGIQPYNINSFSRSVKLDDGKFNDKNVRL